MKWTLLVLGTPLDVCCNYLSRYLKTFYWQIRHLPAKYCQSGRTGLGNPDPGHPDPDQNNPDTTRTRSGPGPGRHISNYDHIQSARYIHQLFRHMVRLFQNSLLRKKLILFPHRADGTLAAKAFVRPITNETEGMLMEILDQLSLGCLKNCHPISSPGFRQEL